MVRFFFIWSAPWLRTNCSAGVLLERVPPLQVTIFKTLRGSAAPWASKASFRGRSGLKIMIFMIFKILANLRFQEVDLCAALALSRDIPRSPRLVETILSRVLETRVSTISEINCGIL